MYCYRNWNLIAVLLSKFYSNQPSNWSEICMINPKCCKRIVQYCSHDPKKSSCRTNALICRKERNFSKWEKPPHEFVIRTHLCMWPSGEKKKFATETRLASARRGSHRGEQVKIKFRIKCNTVGTEHSFPDVGMISLGSCLSCRTSFGFFFLLLLQTTIELI